jgi:hypothetical protein
MAATHRRLVTATRGGKASLVSDERLPAYAFQSVQGFEHTFLWKTEGGAAADLDRSDTPFPTSILPGPGGTTLQIVTYPPGAVRNQHAADPDAAAREYAARLPGLAECFEPEAPGMHATPTVDYAIIADGALTLELDDGVIAEVSAGDIVIQQATRHAWRNRSDRPATVIFVMIDAAD